MPAPPRAPLDAALEQHLFGNPLTVPRELAMCRVAWRYVVSTGPEFHLSTGDMLPMPPGESLPQPEGSDSYNDRYALYVAQFLGDRIAAEVDAYREPPRPLTGSWNGMELVAEALRERGWLLHLHTCTHGYVATVMEQPPGVGTAQATSEKAPLAVGRAALKALWVRRTG